MTDQRFGPSLSLPDDWTEERFERSTFGADDREGIAARLSHDECRIEVLPVEYERTDGVDRVTAVDGDLDHEGLGLDVHGPRDVAPRTAFAVHTRFRPHGSERSVIYTVAADADDALAVACWLARATGSGRDLDDHFGAHGGSLAAGGPSDRLSDDEAIPARLPDDPEKCLFSGAKTRSHELAIPFRFAPALRGYPTTDTGLPRVPTSVAGFDAVVSHRAWTDRSIPALDVPVERTGRGEYGLPCDAWSALNEGDGTRVALERIGE